MRYRLNVPAAAFLLSLATVMMIGLKLEPAYIAEHDNMTIRREAVADKPAPVSEVRPPAAALPQVKTVTPNQPKGTPLKPLPANLPVPAQTGEAEEPDALARTQLTGHSEIGTELYKVTAYYLNVRAKPDKEARIVRVVERGTLLASAGDAGGGWLKLTEGGYVHGGYVEQIRPAAKAKESVAILAYEPPLPAASAAPEVPETPAVADKQEEEPSRPSGRIDAASGLSEAHVATLLDGTELAGHGLEEVILEIEEEYGINAYFTIAVMKLESGNGGSRLARNKNNLFGLNAIDGDAYNKAFRFDTKADCVRTFGELIAGKYMKKGLKTVERVAQKYCPANGKWAKLILNIMSRDYRKL